MDNEITIPGYSLVRKDRHSLTKSCGGGVIIFVRDGIPLTVLSDLIKHIFECLWVEIKRPKCKRMILCCSYRPDDENINLLANLADFLNNIDTENSDIALVGDFNVDYSTKNQLRCKLDEFALQHSLSQIICKPTRVTENSSTTIDLIFANNTHRIVQSDVLQSSISDQSIVFCTIKGGVKKLPPKLLEYRCFKNYNKEAFLRDLSNAPWSIIENANDVDDAVYLWEGLFNSVASDHAPIKSKHVKGNRHRGLQTNSSKFSVIEITTGKRLRSITIHSITGRKKQFVLPNLLKCNVQPDWSNQIITIYFDWTIQTCDFTE